MAVELTELLERSSAITAALVSGVPEDRWSAPSPCEDMSALGLVEHLVGALTQFADVGDGRPPDEAATTPSFPSADAAREFRNAAARMVEVWSRPGVVERDYAMPWGETAGRDLVGFLLIEQVTHGWDLAKATDQEPAYDADLVEATLDLARGYDDPAIRVPGMFGPVVPIADDRAAIDRLAAFLGRDPDGW